MKNPKTKKKASLFAACVLLSVGCICVASTPAPLPDGYVFPNQFPINMGFKSLYGGDGVLDGIGDEDKGIAGNEAFDTATNALRFPIHHGYWGNLEEIKTADTKKQCLLIAAGGSLNPRAELKIYTSSSDTITGTYAGHFLYYVGTYAKAGFGNSGNLTIEVKNAAVFKNSDVIKNSAGEEVNMPRDEHVVIYYRNSNGTPDWSTFEYATLLSSNATTNTITFKKRGIAGSSARSWNQQGGNGEYAYIAAHVPAWETDETTANGTFDSTNMIYRLNYSLHCPQNSVGQQANAWAAEKVGQALIESGRQGMQIDETFNSFNHGDRALDADNNGIGDWGYIDGVNSYGLGFQQYVKNLRARVGTQYILQFDSDSPLRGYRGFDAVNGIQMETFMGGKRFSEAYEHLTHWVESAGQAPKFSYGYCRTATTLYHETGSNNYSPNSEFRKQFAVGLLVGMPHPYGSGKNMGLFDWDEQKGGNVDNYKWLGYPSPLGSGAVREALTTTDLLASPAPTWQVRVSPGYVAKINGTIIADGASYIPDGSSDIEVASIPANAKPKNNAVELQLKTSGLGALVSGKEYTLSFEAKASDSYTVTNTYGTWDFTKTPYQISVGGFGGYQAWVLADKDFRSYKLSFVADNWPYTISLGVGETKGKVWFKNIKFQEGTTHHLSRAFNKGKVFLNMGSSNWEIPVGGPLIPAGAGYKYLGGNTTVNPQNNGQAVSGTVTVPPNDAVFLIK